MSRGSPPRSGCPRFGKLGPCSRTNAVIAVKFREMHRSQKLSDFMQRRYLLRSAAAWVGGAAALAARRPAAAWQLQEINPKSPLGSAYANRCNVSSDHAVLIAQLQARLAQDSSASSVTAICPICGCPVIVGR
jgi:hypothetical protein